MVSFIQRGNSSLEYRRYKKNLIEISLVILIVAIVYTGGNSIVNIVKTNNLKNQNEGLEASILSNTDEIESLKEELTTDETFIIYSDAGDNLTKEKIPTYYENEKLYQYLHQVPETIKYESILVDDTVVRLLGQATSYNEVNKYIDVLKKDKVFTEVEIRGLDYIKTGEKVRFKLMGYKINASSKDKKNIDKIYDKEDK